MEEVGDTGVGVGAGVGASVGEAGFVGVGVVGAGVDDGVDGTVVVSDWGTVDVLCSFPP